MVRLLFLLIFFLTNTFSYAKDFYEGKELKIIIASIVSPTAGFELNTRIVGKYLPKYIPGNPSIVFKNMPAAAGVAGMNMVSEEINQDGTTIIFHTAAVPVRGIMKDSPEIKYDSAEMNWIGAISDGSDDVNLLFARKDLELLPDLSNMLLGDTSATKSMEIGPILKNLLGFKLNIIYGYKTKQEIELALQRKEVNAYFTSYGVLKTTNYNIVTEIAKPVIQYGSGKRNAMFPDVLSLYELAKTEEQREFIDFSQFTFSIHKAVAVGQHVSRDKIEILRKAFIGVCNDKDFLAEMKEKNQPVNCVEGNKVQLIINENVKRYQKIKHLL